MSQEPQRSPRPEPPLPKGLEIRVAELEFLFTHLQRQVADLNQALLEQQRRAELAEKELRALRRRPDSAYDAPEGESDL
jgi:uncharacterized coiled-coil protein SlyX